MTSSPSLTSTRRSTLISPSVLHSEAGGGRDSDRKRNGLFVRSKALRCAVVIAVVGGCFCHVPSRIVPFLQQVLVVAGRGVHRMRHGDGHQAAQDQVPSG